MEELVSKTSLSERQYENTTFTQCTFASLSNITFSNCKFRHCTLEKAHISKCYFDNCTFSHVICNMASFEGTTMTTATFEYSQCIGTDFSKMNYLLSTKIIALETDFSFASFVNAKLAKSQFTQCKLVETNFSDSYMQHTAFKRSDLSGVIVDSADLRHSDFRWAKNYSFRPSEAKIRFCKFSKEEALGMLYSYEITLSEEEDPDAKMV